jgi:hypothetical protein
MAKLATQLIGRQEGKFEPANLEDRYEARLREVIDAKLKGEGITPEEPAGQRADNVIDLMAALKRRLEGERNARAKAAKPQTARQSRKVRRFAEDQGSGKAHGTTQARLARRYRLLHGGLRRPPRLLRMFRLVGGLGRVALRRRGALGPRVLAA